METTQILAKFGIELTKAMPGYQLPHGFTDAPAMIESVASGLGMESHGTRIRVPARGDGPLCLTLIPVVRELGVIPPLLGQLPECDDRSPLTWAAVGGDWMRAEIRKVARPIEGQVAALDVRVVYWLGVTLTITHRPSGSSIMPQHPRETTRYRTMDLPATAGRLDIVERVYDRLLDLIDWSLPGDQLSKDPALRSTCQSAWAPEVDELFKLEQRDAKAWRGTLNALDWKPEHTEKRDQVRHAVWARFFWAAKP